MSDVYSFGVVLLELLTGKRSMDETRPGREQSLVEWVRPLLKDPNKLDRTIDPRLEGQFSTSGALKAAALAYKCLSHHPKTRPTMSYVVQVLESLQNFDDTFVAPFVYVVPNENGSQKCFEMEAGVKTEGENDGNEDNDHHKTRHRHRRSWRHRIKLPLPRVAYSDSALYENIGNGFISPYTPRKEEA